MQFPPLPPKWQAQLRTWCTFLLKWQAQLTDVFNAFCASFLRLPRKQQQIITVAGALFLILVLKSVFSTSPLGHQKDGKTQIQTVRVERVKKGDMPIQVMALGTVTPTTSITIRTQINGQLLRVLFKEGQLVQQGDLLAEIDSRLYTAQLLQYEGQIARDKALLENAQLDLERYKNLAKKEAISKQILDTQVSLVHQYEGTVKSDQGLIDTAKLNQTYCKITAPIAGRVGLRFVDQGNYVQTTDSKGLVIINTIDPISVVFSIPEDDVPHVVEAMHTAALNVEAYDRGQKQLLATGVLETVDNQIDLTTGTVKLRAIFANQNNSLFPNQFVNMRLLVGMLRNEMIIPTVAIQHSPDGLFVYKLNKDNTVNRVSVVLKAANGNDSAVSGLLLVDDVVVVEGTDKLREGMVVICSAQKMDGQKADAPKVDSSKVDSQKTDVPKADEELPKKAASLKHKKPA